MSEESYHENRAKFLIAVMTKDYKKAIDIGSKVLKQNSRDQEVKEILNILQRNINIEENVAESDTSDESGSETEIENSGIFRTTRQFDLNQDKSKPLDAHIEKHLKSFIANSDEIDLNEMQCTGYTPCN